MNSKIKLLIGILAVGIVLAAIIGGGILWFPKKPERIIKNEETFVKDMIIDFMDARMGKFGEGSLTRAKSHLTDNGKKSYSQIGFIDSALVGISNPHYSRYEILESKKLDSNRFEFTVRIYEYLVETKEKGDFDYFYEELTVIKVDNDYLIDSVKRGETVYIQEETADWKTYRNEEYGFEIKYPTTTIYNGLEFYPIEKMDDYIVVIQGSLSDEVKNPYSPFPFVGALAIKVIDIEEKHLLEQLKEKYGLNETVNWKIYQGDGWSVELPLTYESDEPREKDESVAFRQKTFQGINIDDLPTNATAFLALKFKKIQIKPAAVSLFEYVQFLAHRSWEFDEDFDDYIQSIGDPKEIEIDGKSTIQTALFAFEGCPCYAYWFEKSPTESIRVDVIKCFEIGGPFGINGLSEEQRQNIEKEVQKIISTFGFGRGTCDYSYDGKGKVKKIIIGEAIPAVRVADCANKFEVYKNYIEEQDKTILLTFDNPGKDYYIEIFEKILSTFKFIKKDKIE